MLSPAQHLRVIGALGTAAALLAACGGSSGGAPAAGTPPATPIVSQPAPVTLTAAASATELLAGGNGATLTATATGDAAISWHLGSQPGTLSAAAGTRTTYAPPATLAAPATVLVTASAGKSSKTIRLRVYPDPGNPGLSLVAGDPAASPVEIGVDRDGQGAAARFSRPRSITADREGNLYVTTSVTPAGGSLIEDTEVTIRKITPSGAVTTLFSDKSAGHPTGLAVGSDGTLFVSIRPPNSIKRWEPTLGGAVYVLGADRTLRKLAGAGAWEYANPLRRDGNGQEARFAGPYLAGIDEADNLSVEDYVITAAHQDLVYRKVTPQGEVTTIAALPAEIATAPDGNAYRLEGDQVTRTAPDGTKTVVAGIPASNPYVCETVLGALPGRLCGLPGYTRSIVPTGPASFAVLSGAGIVRIVVPH